MKLFTVLDRESNTHLPPFAQPTLRDAIDGFKFVVNDSKTNFNKFPEDFVLIHLGDFDLRSAEITLIGKEIAEAKSLLQ